AIQRYYATNAPIRRFATSCCGASLTPRRSPRRVTRCQDRTAGMAKRTNPKLIGGFVVGALLLTIIGVLAFGGGQFLKPKAKGVIYFQGSLGGLDVGAPVTFRGVKIGTVTNIVIEYDIANQVLHIPVYFELETDKFQVVSGQRNPVKNIDALISRGLRGQLETLSMVTGQVSINFDFHPETPI